MDLEILDADYTSPSRKKHVPAFTFNRKGMLLLSAGAVDLLGFTGQEEAKILLAFDKSRSNDWYITKTDTEKGIVLKKQKNTSYSVNASAITRVFFKTFPDIPHTKNSVRIPIATLPVEDLSIADQPVYALLTKSLEKLNT